MTTSAERVGGAAELLASGNGGGVELRRSLEDLGPVLGTFGHYLATRPDLLSAATCLELSAVTDHAPEAPVEEVLALLEEELGQAPDRLFRELEPRPVESLLLAQTHRARTADGDRPVEVTVVRPGLDRLLEAGLALVPEVARRLLNGSREAVTGLVDDFRAALDARLDLADRAKRIAVLAAAARGDQDLRFPEVDPRLSSRRVLTVERLDGRRLSELLAERARSGAEPPLPDRALARRLHVAWLRLALGGRSFPAELHPSDVMVLADGRIAFGGGWSSAAGPEVRGAMWSYLETAAAGDPADAATDLVRSLLVAERRNGAHRRERERLLQRLRHVVPFRDGAWSPAGTGLAEHLFVEWRLAREAGHRLLPEALPVARGLAAVATLGRRLAPDADPLREALAKLRLLRGFDRLRRSVGTDGLGESAAAGALLALELPRKVDRAIGLLERGELRVRLRPELDGDDLRKGAAGGAVVPALVAFGALAAAAFVAHQLGGPTAVEPRVQRLAAGALLMLGFGLLWALGRRR